MCCGRDIDDDWEDDEEFDDGYDDWEDDEEFDDGYDDWEDEEEEDEKEPPTP